MRFLKNRWLAGIMVAAIIFAVVYAAAASLGLSVDTLSADQQAVESCDSAVDASYTTVYDEGSAAYIVDDVTIGNIDGACDGFDLKVTLAMADGTFLAEVTELSLTGPTVVLDFEADLVLASDVGLIAVSITE